MRVSNNLDYQQNYRFYIYSAIMAILVAILFLFSGREAISVFYAQHPFFGDTFSYFHKRAESASIIEAGGRHLAFDLFLDNPRDPLRSLALAFYPERLMSSLTGTLLFNCAAYAVFAFFFSILVKQRTGLWSLALASMPVVGTMAGFFDPVYGFTSDLPDLPSSLIAGAGMACVLISDRGRKPLWLLAFAALAGLATLTRISAIMYILAMAGPLVLIYLGDLWKRTGWRQPVGIALAGIAIFAALTGYTMVVYLERTLNFYRVAGYALEKSALQATMTTVYPFFREFVQWPFFLLVLIGFLPLTHIRTSDIRWRDLGETVWLVVTTPLLLTVVLALNGDYTQMYYAIPELALLVVAPVSIQPEARSRLAGRRSLGWGTFVVAGGAVLLLVNTAWTASATKPPSNQERAEAQFMRDLTEHIAALRGAATNDHPDGDFRFDVAFTYAGRYVEPQARMTFGIKARWNHIFEIRDSQWALGYNGLDKADTLTTLIHRAEDETNVFAVLADAADPQARDVIVDDYTAEMSRALRDHFRAPESGWRQISTVPGPHGAVEVYVNDRRHGIGARRDQMIAAVTPLIAASGTASPTVGLALSLGTPTVPYAYLPSSDPRSGFVDLIEPMFFSLRQRTPEEAGADMAREAGDKMTMLVLPADPTDPRLLPYVRNMPVATAVRALRDQVVADADRWSSLGSVPTPMGEMTLYLNRNR